MDNQLKDYDAYTPEDGRIVFIINEQTGLPEKPVFLYDGKEHALLYRSPDNMLVFDFLHMQVKKRLGDDLISEVTIVERRDDLAVRTYPVGIKRMPGLPIDKKKISLF